MILIEGDGRDIETDPEPLVGGIFTRKVRDSAETCLEVIRLHEK